MTTPADAAASGASSDERASQLLERVWLSARMYSLPGKLSGGDRKRTSVVRALIHQPLLVLADEPTGALDRTSAGNLGRLLGELNREDGVTLVVVTHSQELAGQMGRTVQLQDGKLITR